MAISYFWQEGVADLAFNSIRYLHDIISNHELEKQYGNHVEQYVVSYERSYNNIHVLIEKQPCYTASKWLLQELILRHIEILPFPLFQFPPYMGKVWSFIYGFRPACCHQLGYIVIIDQPSDIWPHDIGSAVPNVADDICNIIYF